jgi:phosphoribosylformylglycinamidine cyclo-ligase
MTESGGLTYAAAGVNIDQGNKAVELFKPLVARTKRPEVIGGLGGFGGLFALDTQKYQEPILVSGTDGVGTKLAVAQKAGKHDTIGIDCVAMCVNDILVIGAEPLFFLDYLAVGRLEPEQVRDIVAGIAEGCVQAGCALIGGETAEMPGFYKPGEYDVAGFAVGIAERGKIIDGSTIAPGDLALGLKSAGLHSNGYSLARKVFFQHKGWGVDTQISRLGCTLGEELLKPTRIYVKLIRELLQEFTLKGMAHITGGGLIENPPRILPPHTHLELNYGSWPIHPVFELLAEAGQIEPEEMLRTFNMGIGMVLYVDPLDAPRIQEWLKNRGEESYLIGQVTAGIPGVTVRGL